MNAAIDWYRTPLDKNLLRSLNGRDDVRGLVQAGGHLLAFVVTAALCWLAYETRAWLLLGCALFFHGAVASFMTNANHELSHGAVFSSRAINRLFLHIFSFIAWENPYRFWASHTEHHKHTLYPSLDVGEGVPQQLSLRMFVQQAVVDPIGLAEKIWRNILLSFGKYDEDWVRRLFEGQQRRFQLFKWSRLAVALHFTIAVIALYRGFWIVPVIVSMSRAFGGVFFFLCNNTQHAGLMDRVADFRLCCRTLYLNPVLEFFYWRMNFHTEHHMYPAVPCYKLRQLHDAVKHDLPPTLHGIAATWQQIIAIQFLQQDEPEYRFRQRLPGDAVAAARPERAASPE